MRVNNNGISLQLWVGTHHCGPAKIRRTGESGGHETLNDFIRRSSSQNLMALNGGRGDDSPAANGEQKVANDSLPFMVKIMSVAKALSLQLRPTKVGFSCDL